MLRYLITTMSFFLLMMGLCLGQSGAGRKAEPDKTQILKKIEKSIGEIDSSFAENGKTLVVLSAGELQELNKSTKELRQKLDALQSEAETELEGKAKKLSKEEFSVLSDSVDSLVVSTEPANTEDTSSQENENETRITINEDELTLNFGGEDDSQDELDKVQFDYLSFDLGFTNYLSDGDVGAPGSASFLALNEGKSSNVKITAVKAGFSLIDHNLSLLTGLGIDYYNYRFRNQQALTSTDGDDLATRQFDESYDKYKLATQYAFAPVELRYETNPEDPGSSFKLSAGGKFGYLIRSHTKLKRDNGNKAKDFGNFNVNPVRLDAVARIGYGRFLNFYATYGLTSVFENQVEPDLTPVSIGVNIFGFNWD